MDGNFNVRCGACGTLNRIPAGKGGLAARCGQCGAGLDTSATTGSAFDVTDADFDSRVRGSSKPVLVEFWSPSCGHCVRMAPILDDLARELAGKVRVARLDVAVNPRVSSLYEIRATPTFVLVAGGREAARFMGAMQKEDVLRRIRPYI